MLPNEVYEIYGFLSPAEMQLLYDLAADCDPEDAIVEIGSFQGKSTVCLGLGAKQSGAKMYSIDPHEDGAPNAQTHYGMENQAALLRNLTTFCLGDVVRVVTLPSVKVASNWQSKEPIGILWVDGSHLYEDICDDLYYWSPYVVGKIAMHDTSGHYPDVNKALDEFLKLTNWELIHQVDATAILERSDV